MVKVFCPQPTDRFRSSRFDLKLIAKDVIAVIILWIGTICSLLNSAVSVKRHDVVIERFDIRCS